MGLEGTFGHDVLEALKLLCEDENSLEPETIELTARDCGDDTGTWSVRLTLTGREKLDVKAALAEMKSARRRLHAVVQCNIQGGDK